LFKFSVQKQELRCCPLIDEECRLKRDWNLVKLFPEKLIFYILDKQCRHIRCSEICWTSCRICACGVL